jgi:hypothetical protein
MRAGSYEENTEGNRSNLRRDTRPIDWLAARNRTLPLRPFQAAKPRRQNAIPGVPFACYPRRGFVADAARWAS